MASFVLEAGTTTSSWRARVALRMRVSMSAIGSDTFMGLPARLRHARELAHQGTLAETDAAHSKAAHERPRSPADHAAVVTARRELGLALRLRDERLLGHTFFLPRLLAGEG